MVRIAYHRSDPLAIHCKAARQSLFSRFDNYAGPAFDDDK